MIQRTPLRRAPVGRQAQVQVLALQQAVHELEELHHQLVLPQVVARLVDQRVPLAPPAAAQQRLRQPLCAACASFRKSDV